MSFKDMTPEQRSAMAKKSAETRRLKREERVAQSLDDQVEAAKIALDVADPTLQVDNLRLLREAEEHFTDMQIAEPEIVYGDIEEPAAVEPEIGDVSPFGLFLASLDAETRELLSDDELHDIYDAQVAKAQAEKKAAKKKAAAELAGNAARMEAGLIPMATIEEMETKKRNSEMVRFTVELPPAGDNGEVADIGLRIDQKVWLHGHTYTVTRAQFDSMRENIYRAGEMELTFKGQNRRMRQYMLGRALDAQRWHIPLNGDGSPQ